jgi:hypothetical protein
MRIANNFVFWDKTPCSLTEITSYFQSPPGELQTTQIVKTRKYMFFSKIQYKFVLIRCFSPRCFNLWTALKGSIHHVI